MRGWIVVAYVVIVGLSFVFTVVFAVASRNEKKRADAYKVLAKLTGLLTLVLYAVLSAL